MGSEQVPLGVDGFYCLCLQGPSLSDDEIYDTFQDNGIIQKINRSGKFAFLKYQTIEEAEETLKQFANHSQYVLRAARVSKFKNDDDRNFNSNKSEGSPSLNHSQSHENHRYSNTNNRDMDGRQSKFKHSNAWNSDQGCMPPLKFKDTREDEIPDLVPRGESAKQVLIANLPCTIMQYQVYRLCKNGEPLHVDIFKTEKKITYAHVHVKSNKHVELLKDELSGLQITDKKLVVLTPDELLAKKC